MSLQRIAIVICAALLPLAALAQTGPKKKVKKKKDRGIHWTFDRAPTLHFAKNTYVELGVRLQTDFRTLTPDYETDAGLFDLRRARLALEGRITKDWEFEFGYAFDEQFPGEHVRDAYLNYRRLRDFQIQAGKFKIPFSREQLIGAHRLDFVYRSRAGDQIAPGRDLGIMAHGRFFKRALNYQAGWFAADGENARNADRERTAKRVWAGRVTALPLRIAGLPESIRNTELAFSANTSSADEDLGGLRGRSVARETIFPRVYVKGRRVRWGTELAWAQGPLSFRSEFMNATTARKGQGFAGEDLPSVLARGWFAAGTWLVTGEPKLDRIAPRRDFLTGGGPGAIELAARYEQIRFGSTGHPGEALRNPRAPNLVAQSDRAWTFGVNWYWNRWVRLQVNHVREHIEDAQRAPLEGHGRFGMWVYRLQFVM